MRNVLILICTFAPNIPKNTESICPIRVDSKTFDRIVHVYILLKEVQNSVDSLSLPPQQHPYSGAKAPFHIQYSAFALYNKLHKLDLWICKCLALRSIGCSKYIQIENEDDNKFTHRESQRYSAQKSAIAMERAREI